MRIREGFVSELVICLVLLGTIAMLIAALADRFGCAEG